MKKKIIIVSSVILFIVISLLLIISYLNRYNLVCTRELVDETQNFYISFNFFGNLEDQVLESQLYFDTNDEAKNYYSNLIKNNEVSKENIKIENTTITLYEYGIGIIQDNISSKKINEVKKIYEEHGYTCKEVKK